MLPDRLRTFVVPLAIFSIIVPASAFFRMSCPSLVIPFERIDPIVSPGEVSGHVHGVAGGNGLNFTTSYQQARSSTCSSCPIKQDLSNYWTPRLYYHAENGSFISVPLVGDGDGRQSGMTVYYLQRPGSKNDPLQAFPEGFRMLAGDPFRRNYTGDFAAQAISYACLDYSQPATKETNGFPDRNCPDGIRAQVFFPSCWDGTNPSSTDRDNPHVVYPVSGSYNDGDCPPSHKNHLVSIFYEVLYDGNRFANLWYGNSQPFVWANGDPTGYGFHGDFLNGWDVGVLQSAIDHCLDLSGDVKKCTTPDGAPIFDFFTDQECQDCKVPRFINEQVDGVLPSLPGCNPLTSGPAEASPAPCQKAPIGAPAPLFTDLTKTNNWKYVGCGTDDISSRTFSGQSTSDSQMTVIMCVKFCSSKGYGFAGLEYADQCYCGNSLPSDRAPAPGFLGSCSMPCAGDSTEFCGGAPSLSIYQSCANSSSCENPQYGPPGNVNLKRRISPHRRHHHDY